MTVRSSRLDENFQLRRLLPTEDRSEEQQHVNFFQLLLFYQPSSLSLISRVIKKKRKFQIFPLLNLKELPKTSPVRGWKEEEIDGKKRRFFFFQRKPTLSSKNSACRSVQGEKLLQRTYAKTPCEHSFQTDILQRIKQEATRQKRSRSEYVELHFEDAFAKQ